MNYMLLGLTFCFLSSPVLFGADKKKQGEITFPYGDRICGARLLNAIENRADIEKALKGCNAQGAYIGAFNQVIESSKLDDHVTDPVRYQLFMLGRDYGRREERYSWNTVKWAGWNALAVGFFSVAGGFCTYKWLNARSLNNSAARSSAQGPK